MATDDISFSITADIDQMTAALLEASATTTEAMTKIEEATKLAGDALDKNLSEGAKKATEETEKLNESFGGIGEALEKIKSQINGAFEVFGITAAYEGVEKVVDALNEAAESAARVSIEAAQVGLSTDQYQAFSEVAKEADQNADGLARSILKLNNTLNEARTGSSKASEELQKLGLSTKEINDPNTAAIDIIQKLSAGLRSAATSAEVSAEVTAVYGVRARGLITILKEYSGTQEETNSINARVLALSKEQIEVLEGQRKKTVELGSTTHNILGGIFADFLKLREMQNNSGGSNATAFAEIERNAQFEIEFAKKKALEEKEEAEATATATTLAANKAAIAQMDADTRVLAFFKEGTMQRRDMALKAAEDTQAAFAGQDNDKTRAAWEMAAKAAQAYSERVIRDSKTIADAVAESQDRIVLANLDGAKKILDAQEALKQISPESYAAAAIAVVEEEAAANVKLYTAKKAALIDDGINNASNTAQRLALNAQIYAETSKTESAIAEIRKKAAEDTNKALEEQNAVILSSAKIQEETAKGQEDAAAKILKAQESANQISPTTYATAMAAVYTNMEQIQEAYFQAEKDGNQTALDQGLMTLDEWKKKNAEVDADIAKSKASLNTQIAAVNAEAANKVDKAWEGVGKTIGASFTTAIDGMITRTETFQQAFKKMADGLALDFVNSTIKTMVAGWVKGEGEKLAASEGGKRILEALNLENLITSKTTSSTGAISEINAAAAVAAANAFAATAAIPYVGPELAPAAAAEAEASTLAFQAQVASAAGGWQVPSDQLAMVHEDEMILPSHITKGINDMIQNNRGGEDKGVTHNNYSIAAHDAKSMEKYFSSAKNRNIIAGAMKKANMRGSSNARIR